MAQFSAAAGNGPDLHICCASPTHCRGRADPHLQSAAPDTATGTALLGAALPRELQEGTRCPGRSCYHTGALPQPSAAPEQAEQSPTERPTAVLSVCRRETSLSTAWLPKANAHLRLLPHPQCCVLRGDSTAGTRCYGDTVLWGHGAMGTRCYMGCAVQGRRAKAVCEWGSHIHRCNASTARNPSAASAWHTHSSAHKWIKASLCISCRKVSDLGFKAPSSTKPTTLPPHDFSTAPCWGAAAPATALRCSPHAAGEAEGPTQGSRQQRPGTNPHPNPRPSCEPSRAGRLLGGGHGVRGAGFIITGAVLCFT